jgi:fused signal recognition particle receptor
MAWWRRGGKKDKTGDGEPPAETAPAETTETETETETGATEAPIGAFARLRRGLRKTAAGFRQLVGLRRKIDADLLDELEVKMYEADFGPELVADIGEEVRAAWTEGTLRESDQIAPFLKDRFLGRLAARDPGLARAGAGPTVVLVAGVNGTGKTTSIAKLARFLKDQGRSVLLAAADTFRAAATEQLQIWSERVAIPLVTGSEKKDPAAVAYTACERAQAEGIDYLIVDTAGRLHTQVNLMRELEKVRRVMAKQIEGAPHEVLLVLDATVGQNAVSQAESFNAAVNLTGLILAKLDGTAKGGVVLTLNNRFQIPVKFVGLGEKVEDWAPFDPARFVEALFS